MFVVIVQAHVKPEFLDDFITATIDNASNSLREAGVARFDFYQQENEPTCFNLIEVYRSEDAPIKHRETSHYNRWRETVESMLVEPRTKTTYNIIFPPEAEW
ncbi:MAG: antibiotic biosynthesis monooxygenase [Acidobacteriaceae bacterium]